MTHTGLDIFPLGSFLSLLSIVVIKHWPKSTWGGKGSICLRIQTTVQLWKPRQEGRNWSRSHGELLLTGSLPLAYSVYFFIYPKATWPGVVLPKWVVPFHTNHQLRKAHGFSKASPRRYIVSMMVPSSQVTQLVSADKNPASRAGHSPWKDFRKTECQLFECGANNESRSDHMVASLLKLSCYSTMLLSTKFMIKNHEVKLRK